MSDILDQMDQAVREALEERARKTGQTLADVLSDAGRALLSQGAVRDEVRQAADAVVEEHAELLARLAK